MLTGELRNKIDIDRLWETFWTGGITNPLDVVEQMTYLMFIRDLDETDGLRSKESAMLGLPHRSIFAGEVKVGERAVAGGRSSSLTGCCSVPPRPTRISGRKSWRAAGWRR